MPFILADRVKQTSTVTGTGVVVLASTPSGYRSFASVLSTNDTTYYCIAHQTANQWEVGYGTYTAANQLTRTRVISSSNANNLVVFTAGDKDVFITPPAMGTYNNNVVIGTGITYNQNTNQNNVVIGKGSISSGDANVVIGDTTNANTYSAVVIGANAQCAGPEGTAIGYTANVLSANGVAIGRAVANANSVSIGNQALGGVTGSVAIGQTASVGYASTQWGIAIGSGANVRAGSSIVIGAQTKDSSGGDDIRVGFNQDAAYPSGASGTSNILLGNNIVSAVANPSNSIAIGNGIPVTQSDATFMNKFRINPTSGLTGPAYTLTYDSTTHEVYAVTSGPPPPVGPGWFTYEDYSSTASPTIDLPSDWSTTYSGPSDEMFMAGYANGSPYGPPTPGSWSYAGASTWGGFTYTSASTNWGGFSTPTNVNSSGPADGYLACWIYGVQGDSATGYYPLFTSLGNTTVSSGPSYPGFPLIGSSPRYGHTVVFIWGGDFTTTATAPTGGTIVGSVYDAWSNTTILFIEYNDAAVSSIQAGSISLFTLPSSKDMTVYFWYNYT